MKNELIEALEGAQRLFKEALPKFNWGASALDANAIQLLNEVPGKVQKALESAKAEAQSAKLIGEVVLSSTGGDYADDYKDIVFSEGFSTDELPLGTKIYATAIPQSGEVVSRQEIGKVGVQAWIETYRAPEDNQTTALGKVFDAIYALQLLKPAKAEAQSGERCPDCKQPFDTPGVVQIGPNIRGLKHCENICHSRKAQSGETSNREYRVKIIDLIWESLMEDFGNMDSAFSFDEIAGHVFEKIKHFIQVPKPTEVVSREEKAIREHLLKDGLFAKAWNSGDHEGAVNYVVNTILEFPKPAAPIPSEEQLTAVMAEVTSTRAIARECAGVVRAFLVEQSQTKGAQ